MINHQYEYLIALGSNVGDRLSMLNKAAVAMQEKIGAVVSLSTIYETEPLGAADAFFLNAVILLFSNTAPNDILNSILAIEMKLGRKRTLRWGNRTIDLDILLLRAPGSDQEMTGIIFKNNHLSIPHPEMLQRDFVMIPAEEIAGHWLHPETNRTLSQEKAHRFPDLIKPPAGAWKFDVNGLPDLMHAPPNPA